jgi:hypothetical protein
VLLPGPAVAIELSVMAIPHLAFIGWLVASDRAMRAQRTIELARMRELQSGNRDPGTGNR